MNLVFLQRLDREGGGSRASLKSTLQAIRQHRPQWNVGIVTQERGPLTEFAAASGIGHWIAEFPRFRKPLERLVLGRRCGDLAAQLHEFQPTHVISNEWITAPHARRVAATLGARAASYVRDFAAVERGKKYELHRMDRLLCVCDQMREALTASYDPGRLKTVYNYVRRFEMNPPDPALLERIRSHVEVDRWLLYVGRISQRKNQIAAVDTLRLLRETTGAKWGLMLVGDADEAYEAEVNHTVVEAGLGNCVLTLGMVKEPGWLFEHCEATILTSKSEGLARVLIESFLLGKPAFSMPLDGLEDIYGARMSFYVPEHAEPPMLARKIAEALATQSVCRVQTDHIRGILEQRHALESHLRAFETAIR